MPSDLVFCHNIDSRRLRAQKAYYRLNWIFIDNGACVGGTATSGSDVPSAPASFTAMAALRATRY